MSVAKVIELNASSATSMEDAVKHGLKKCAESVKNIEGAWVNEIKVVTDNDGLWPCRGARQRRERRHAVGLR